MNSHLGRISILSFRLTYISLAKLGLTVFILYVFWFLGAFYENRVVLYGSILFSTIAILGDMIRHGNNINAVLSSIVPLLIVYGIYSAFTGIFTHINFFYLYKSLFTLFSFTLVCFNVCYISSRSKDFQWIFNIFIFASILCAIQTIFWGVEFRSAGVFVTTMGEDNNPNGLAIVMLTGIYSLFKDLKGSKSLVICGLLSLVFLYVILLTGSRKSLIAAIVLFGIWTILSLVDKNTEISKKRKYFLIIAILLLIGTIIYYYIHLFSSTAIYERFLRLENGEAINGRNQLYQYAIFLFFQKPFLGVGYDQYRCYVGEMSHSTYAEILACSGIIGVFLWVFYYFKYLKLTWKLIKKVKKSKYTFELGMSIGILFVEILLGFGQVWFYEINHLLILTSVIGNLNLIDKLLVQKNSL